MDESATISYQSRWYALAFRRLGPIALMKLLSFVFDYMSNYLAHQIDFTVPVSSQPFETEYLPELVGVLMRLKTVVHRMVIRSQFPIQQSTIINSFSVRVKIDANHPC
jgi:hypothetical protein